MLARFLQAYHIRHYLLRDCHVCFLLFCFFYIVLGFIEFSDLKNHTKEHHQETGAGLFQV